MTAEWDKRIEAAKADKGFMEFMNRDYPDWQSEYSGDMLGMHDAWMASRAEFVWLDKLKVSFSNKNYEDYEAEFGKEMFLLPFAYCKEHETSYSTREGCEQCNV